VTTNYRDAFYLRPDDRRHYVQFSERHGKEFPTTFWNEFWNWYETGGFAHVAALLYQYDLKNFDPKAEPPKTKAFWDMVQADRGAGFGELIDAIEALGNPSALTLNELMAVAPGLEGLRDPSKRRATSHQLMECQYLNTRNPNADDGLWKIAKRRQAIYVRADLSPDQRVDAANAHQAKFAPKGG